MYSGSSPVSGYFVDCKEEGSEEWTTVNEATTASRYLKVRGPFAVPCLPEQGLDPCHRPAGELQRPAVGTVATTLVSFQSEVSPRGRRWVSGTQTGPCTGSSAAPPGAGASMLFMLPPQAPH